MEFHEKDYDRILAIISSEGETVHVSLSSIDGRHFPLFFWGGGGIFIVVVLFCLFISKSYIEESTFVSV